MKKEEILLNFLENKDLKLKDVIEVLRILIREKFILTDDYLIDRLIVKRKPKQK